jgi:hypothetical protein
MSQVLDAITYETQDRLIQKAREINLGVEVTKLSPVELEKWKKSFRRSFVMNGYYRNWNDIDLRHLGEYLLGAMVAKKQFGLEFDGTQPFPGRFGMSRIRAGHVGIADNWDEEGSATESTVKRWVHSGAALAGTAGNAIRVEKSMVLVITGIGDLRQMVHGLPSAIESFVITVDAKQKPVICAKPNIMISDYPILEFDEAILAKYKTTLLIEYWTNETTANPDVPFLWGMCYAPESQLRISDPASLYATTSDMVVKT